MLARKVFVVLMSLVILARAANCLCVEATLCAYAIAAASENPPLADPNDADPHESGCLCKGALLPAPCIPAELEPRGPWVSPVAALDEPAARQSAIHPTPYGFLAAHPPSGRTLRAWLASWRI